MFPTKWVGNLRLWHGVLKTNWPRRLSRSSSGSPWVTLDILVRVEDAQGDPLRQLAAVLVLVPDGRGLWLLPRRR
jgi:hypothetical protein